MACFHPLNGYRSRVLSPSGKRSFVFNAREGFYDLPMTVPCGQCVGCRLERSRQWAIRCMHEASLYAENCFITLTYSDEFLPVGGSLDKSAFQKFMKRLRKRFAPQRIRFYHCGEYGDIHARPHYHGLLFGFDFLDKRFWSVRRGLPVFRSPVLEALWPFGLSEIGSVTFESAAYVARYIMKKVLGKDAAAYYERVDPDTGDVVSVVPEYSTMSRRPGIGRPWLDMYMCEVYPADSVVVRGRLMKPPRFYDLQYEVGAPVGAASVKRRRLRKRHPEDETPERVVVREKCAEARVSSFVRGLE